MKAETKLILDESGSFKRFVRQLSSQGRNIGYYACIDHSIISPVWEDYLAVPFGEFLPEHPRMINILIDTFDFESSIKRAKGLKLPTPDLDEFLAIESKRILPNPKTLGDLENLLISDKQIHFFSSFDCKVVTLAALKILRGDELISSIEYAQNKFECKLRYKDFVEERLKAFRLS